MSRDEAIEILVSMRGRLRWALQDKNQRTATAVIKKRIEAIEMAVSALLKNGKGE